MARALIGHSGLVGGNLLRAWSFDQLYNSKNITEIDDRKFDLVVCAGAAGYKWLVNKDPQADRLRIDNLLSHLKTITARSFLLISTIDIYPDSAAGCDESFFPSQPPVHPYGLHRWQLEAQIRELFPQARIVRLPGVYGENLKKNLIFDLLHRHYLEECRPDCCYQWYWLEHLGRDLELALQSGAGCVNLFTEPVSTAELIAGAFADDYELAEEGLILKASGRLIRRSNSASLRDYNLHTAYGELFGQPAGSRYIQSRAEVLSDLSSFRRRQNTGGSGISPKAVWPKAAT